MVSVQLQELLYADQTTTLEGLIIFLFNCTIGTISIYCGNRTTAGTTAANWCGSGSGGSNSYNNSYSNSYSSTAPYCTTIKDHCRITLDSCNSIASRPTHARCTHANANTNPDTTTHTNPDSTTAHALYHGNHRH